MDAFDEPDEYEDPELINGKLRDAIAKQLERTDLSPSDRAEYQHALENLTDEETSS